MCAAKAVPDLALFGRCVQGYCGLEPVPLIGRVESREDVATAVAAALNSAALRAAQGTPLNNILAGAGPALGPQVCAHYCLTTVCLDLCHMGSNHCTDVLLLE